MKKLILTAAIAALAGTANAATVYKGAGLTYDLGGDVQVQLRKPSGKDDIDVEYDDLELYNGLSYDLGNGLSAFAQVDFSFDGMANNTATSPALENAYVGFSAGDASILVGTASGAGDDFGVAAAIEGSVADDVFDAYGSTGGDDLVRVDLTSENFAVVLSTELSTDDSSSASTGTMEALVAVELGGVSLAAAYQSIDTNVVGAAGSIWGVSAAVDTGSFGFAADFSSSDEDHEILNLVATLPVGASTAALGYQTVDVAGTETTGWYANLVYTFPSAENVSLFAEVSDDDASSDIGYLAGMEISF